MRASVAVVVAALVASCHLGPASSAGLDASDGSVGDLADLACGQLKTLGCAEGSSALCQGRLRTMTSENHLTDADVMCVADANSKAAARACAAWYLKCP